MARYGRRITQAGLIASLLTLGGCGMFSDRSGIEYKSASKLPPLEVPPDLTRPGRDDRYAVPDSPQGGSTTLSATEAERRTAPRAGSTEVLPSVDKVRMARAGSERWLVVPEPPEKLWPLVKEFWQDSGFVLGVDQPDVGVMETDWAENRAKIPNDGLRSILGRVLDTAYSTGERDKFRTRLERGTDGGTEIFMSHRGMVETIVNSARGQEGTIWQPRAPNADLEAEFLRRLMVRLGVDDQRAKAQLAAVQARPSDRARLSNGTAGGEVLLMQEPFDRAWRRVGVALDRVGFTVEDRDRSKGLYFVRYVDPKLDEAGRREGGLLSRLAFWRSNDARTNPNEQYRVTVKGATDDNSVVEVLSKDGVTSETSTAKRILALLHEQLK
jgi:outer membrane protein assembly factor BamC